MAGTIFSLALSQRVDPNGSPEAGWKLYLYTANTSTPITAYKDSGLTAGLEQPWPIVADAYGMMADFWVADGSYRARGTSSDGSRVFFDRPNVLAIGPSSGSGGGGSSVDPNTIFQTGWVMWMDYAGTLAGWVRDNGRTIGSATSGATERANSDTQSLFEWLWNNFSDTICPVVGGRGASASADWAANKQITLPDKRGYVPGGLSDMGNSESNRWSAAPVVLGTDGTTAGGVVGEEKHTLTEGELPSLTKPFSSTPTYIKISGTTVSAIAFEGTGSNIAVWKDIAQTATSVSGGQISFGSGQGHSTIQKTVLGTFFRKL